MTWTATPAAFPLARAFTIARGSRTEARVVEARVARNGAVGRAECVPYARYGETEGGVLAALAGLPPDVTRDALDLPPGAARNAADCALWDHEAKRTGRPVWALAGLAPPRPVTTAFTLSLDTPEAMEAQARAEAERPVLKIKLGAEGDMARLEAVRRGAPSSRLIVDANEGWSLDAYVELAPHLARLGVALVEQPLPAGGDEGLAEVARPVPVCADESIHTRADLAALAGRYDAINVKLDKAGGLTEALALAAEARARGFGVMVGCMVGSSLAMAPALLVAQGADWVDLDGPLLLAQDRPHALAVEGSRVHPPDPLLWG